MKSLPSDNGLSYCGRLFSPEEINRIRFIISAEPYLDRARISRKVCEEFQWYKRDGGLKETGCRVALLRMHRDKYIVLPPPKNTNGNGKIKVTITASTDPPKHMIIKSAGEMNGPGIQWVDTNGKSRIWNEYLARYHYLGYTPLPGAQLRFFVYNNDILPACMGLGDLELRHGK